MTRSYHSRRKKHQLFRQMAWLLPSVVVVCILAVLAGRFLDNQEVYSDSDFASGKLPNTIEIDGVTYRHKTRVKTYLFMGIDERSVKAADNEAEYVGTGQCDVLELVVVDQNANTYAVLPINRDTITAVKSLEDDGTYIATSDVQIALAHANGDGGEMSCENTVDAVSNLLNGQRIDGYAALYMDSIGVINRLAGGITVPIEDDFSQADPTLKIGSTVTLTDEQAELYVRRRMDVGDGTNEGRMRRQSVYLNELKRVFEQKFSEDESQVKKVYESLEDYMVTNLTGKDCSKLAKAMLKNKSLGELQIEGTVSLDELGYRQFIPDEDSLMQTVLLLFYDVVTT